jgi:heptosyltransferase-2
MKILIIKLGALGDVLRTTPLLTALRAKYPQAHITWIVEKQHRVVLEGNPLIEALLNYDAASLERIVGETYDWVINLDKETEALLAMERAKEPLKSGFKQSAQGKVVPADVHSEYAHRLGVDDDLKFRLNQKTYQEISFEQLGLKFKGEEYLFSVRDSDKKQAAAYLSAKGFDGLGSGKPVIGLNTGSGWRFAGKKLSREQLLTLCEKLVRDLGATVLLLGGEDEKLRNAWIENNASVPVINTGSHPIRVFAAIVEKCDLVITGDTTAMHIAIAVKTPAIVHFGSTCASEIELYGRGRKLITALPCAPCYKRTCPLGEPCMQSWSAPHITQQAKEVLAHEATRIS